MNKKPIKKNSSSKKKKTTHKIDNKKVDKWVWVALAVVVITTFFIYFKAISFNLLYSWDDCDYVTNNDHIRSLQWVNIKLFFSSFYIDNYHPLTMLFYAFDYKIGSSQPWVFHLNNILLHIINTYLVFVLIRKISPENIMVALITAAFFAVHPMHVESVAWVSERKDVLYSLFFLLSLIMYFDYNKNQKLKYLIFAGAFFVLSCLSKSAAVILPLVMLLIDYYVKRKLSFKMIAEKIPFFAVSLVFGLVAVHSQKGALSMAPNMTIIEHVSVVTYSFMSYILKAFIPLNLSAVYTYPVQLGSTLPIMYYLSVLCVGLLLFFVIYSLRWGKDVVFGFLFFIITIILVLQFVQVGATAMSERYTYIPYIGIFFMIGKLFTYLSDLKVSYKRVSIAILVLGFITFSIIADARVSKWENDDTLFSDVITKFPNSYISYNNRGVYYVEYYANNLFINDNSKKDMYIKKGITDFEKAIIFAYSPGEKGDANNNMGFARYLSGDYKSALSFYEKSIASNPDNGLSYLNRADYYLLYEANTLYANDNIKKEMCLRKAVMDYEKAIKLKLYSKKEVSAYSNLGGAKCALGDFESAINDFDKALSIDKNYAALYFNRGYAKFSLKNYKGALDDYNKAIELNPKDANAIRSRDMVKTILGNTTPVKPSLNNN